MMKRFRAWLGVVPSNPPRGSRSDILAFSVSLCVLFCDPKQASATTTKQDAYVQLARALDADELTRATIVRHVGDESVLAALQQSQDLALRLAAVRCSPYLSDPDRALMPLTQLARGTDPELAPAAALRLFWIAQWLMQHSAGREIALDSVRETQRALRALADDRTALERIRLLAGQASFLLGQLLQPE